MAAHVPPASTPNETPRSLGYRMPAEWDRHKATWLSWPYNRRTWSGQVETIPLVWADLVRRLSAYEPVYVLAGSGPVWESAQALVGGMPGVTMLPIETDDAWARDHGPTFLVPPPGGEAALIDWKFNAWGGKYPCALDDRVPGELAVRLGMRRFQPGIVLEGGSIDVNGCGSVLTTEQCLLNPNRNPHLARQEIEGYLADYLNAPHVLWLGQGIVGDDTDGHVDDLTRFVGPRIVVTVVEEDPRDENYAALADNLDRLITMTDQDDRSLEIVALPTPQPVVYQGVRLPASYANFYIANGTVIVPTFGDPADAEAIDILSRLFPGRLVQGLYARDLVRGRGTVHCITQQQPDMSKKGESRQAP